MEAAALELENFLPYRLNRLADAVSRDFARIYKDRHGLTRPEWRLLATLGQYGAMTATEIGAHSSMHKTKVSRAVAALEKRLWLARATDDADRRVENLTLTRAGQRVYRELVPFARAFEAAMLAALRESERKALLTGLDALERGFAR
ncbi:MarR family transcriptional regulator [Nitratireductor mangrovi]|uniref:MarR family transcriptional regulator n=2 Tax=Nitratireductor mangrovi TaxID=2599600 RepID=A0A5B8L5H0_9HYPH|nr:MarR family transcriptional regulator [Nitratireductor mangrovi]